MSVTSSTFLARQETLAQLNRCLVHIERPEIQKLLLSGYTATSFYYGSIGLSMSSRDNIYIDTEFYVDIPIDQGCISLFFFRKSLAQMLRNLRNPRYGLSQDYTLFRKTDNPQLTESDWENTRLRTLATRGRIIWEAQIAAEQAQRRDKIRQRNSWRSKQAAVTKLLSTTRAVCVKAGPRIIKKIVAGLPPNYAPLVVRDSELLTQPTAKDFILALLQDNIKLSIPINKPLIIYTTSWKTLDNYLGKIKLNLPKNLSYRREIRAYTSSYSSRRSQNVCGIWIP